MKKLKGLSLILCITMLMSLCNFSAYANGKINVAITISRYGEIVSDTNGDFVAEAKVSLTGKSSYTLDDVFREAHNLYYSGGAEAGYATEVGDYGLGVTKVWGDTSGKFGYQINHGTVSVWGPTETVNDGDYIDLCIYENYWPDTESYAIFNEYTKTFTGNETELTLTESYYDEYYNVLFKPCQNASITVNGTDTGILTDANGKFTLEFAESGEYIVSAKKTKQVFNALTTEYETVNALAAPVCIINVTTEEDALLHNAFAKIVEDGISENSEMFWVLGDIAGYFELYPEKKSILTAQEKQKCLNKIIDFIDTNKESASDMAKAIIALRSMGYDARKVHGKNGEELDLVGILGDYIDNGTNGAASIYALPYIIMAMQEYATDTQEAALINAVLTQKDAWQDTFWGVDAATPMMLALAPYYNSNGDIKTALDEAVDLVIGLQSDSGAIKCVTDWYNMTWGDSTASTGLAIAGLSAIGKAPETIIKSGNSIINGLMSRKTAEGNALLTNQMDTEQGLRGLVEWKLSKVGKRIYDFTGYENNIAYAVSESSGGHIVVEQKEEKPETISVKVKVMAHSGNECNNSYTYKSNSDKYTALVSNTVEIEKGQTVYDATVKVLSKNGIAYEDRSGYIAQIGEYGEFDHGNNSGWMFMVNGEHQSSGAKDVTLNKNATVLWYFTDDYTQEIGSESYQNGGASSDSGKKDDTKADNENADKTVEPAPQKRVFQNDTFADVKENDWHFEAVKFVYENNLMSGTEKGFEPDAKMTRAMLVSVLFRLSGEELGETDITFGDVPSGEWYSDGILWAASVGIVSGVGDNNFAPDIEITREQMAVILYNFARYKNQLKGEVQNEKVTEFEDFGEISDYAKTAILWANAEGFISGESATNISPKNSATRAQIASLLMRYCGANAE